MLSVHELYRLCSDIGSPTAPAVVAERILTMALKYASADRGTVFLNQKDKLVSFVGTGISKGEITIGNTQGIAGLCYESEQGYIVNNVDNDPRFFAEIDKRTKYKTKDILVVPIITSAGQKLGVFQLLNSLHGEFTEDDLQALRILTFFMALVVPKKAVEARGGVWQQEHQRLELISKNQKLHSLYELVPKYALSDSNIYIQGETGTGKEYLAQYVHYISGRNQQPFVAVNCAAIPESLFEAELFGVAKGAATGTVERKGKLEQADGGTLFLDEIGELPLSMQAKLLRVLQDKMVQRLGAEGESKRVNFRLITATNRDLKKMAQLGKFREDLYFRLNVIKMQIPCLKDRPEDIISISEKFLRDFSLVRGWPHRSLSHDAKETLLHYSWPGNIRELQNTLESASIRTDSATEVTADDLQLYLSDDSLPTAREPTTTAVTGTATATKERDFPLNLDKARAKLEAELIAEAMTIAGGNKTKAAKLLGISREGLRKAMIRAEKLKAA